MSKLTQALNRSTSWTSDLVIAIVLGAVAGFLISLLPLGWIPIIGPFLPAAGGGVTAYAVMERQRRILRSVPATF